jgi:hypothetical protein
MNAKVAFRGTNVSDHGKYVMRQLKHVIWQIIAISMGVARMTCSGLSCGCAAVACLAHREKNMMSQRNSLLASLGAALLILFTVVGFAASLSQSNTPTVDVVQVDFNRLISAAVKDRNRFAVDIPRIVDASQAGIGSWSVVRGMAIWRYSVRVPTAVSLSFHAANIFLPPSAQLRTTP